MSLINQMLQDLEQRQGGAGKTQPISGEVRAVPVAKHPVVLKWVVLLGLGILLALSVWAYVRLQKPEPAVEILPSSPLPASGAAASAAPAPAVPAPVVESSTSVPEPVAVAAAPVPVENPTIAAMPAERPVEPRPTRPAPVTEPALPAVAMNVEAQLPVTDQVPKAKPVPKQIPGHAAAPIKTISRGQQSDNLYRQSLAQLQQGRVTEALDALNKALGLNPRNLKARQALLGLLVESGRAEEASQLLREGLELSPEQSGFSMALARLQVESGDTEAAHNTLRDGLQHAGEDAEYHAFYAALLQRGEQHAEAVQHYLTALKSNPAMPAWLVGVGISLQAQGNVSDAAAAFRRAQETGQLTPQLAQFVEQRLGQLK